ncbi:MAG TPA: hypothetical protein VEW46_15535 [Pyrinomonadaceae bacterium]|nr:hypothetical protein [Pyrinomonadaceae bacterium]
MKNRILPLTLLVISLALTFGCSASGKKALGSTDAKDRKGIPATQICQMLAHPSFESRSEYDGAGCSGSTYFGAKDIRTASYETDIRPSFGYAALGEQGEIKKVILTMSKRPDGTDFFINRANAVAKMINDEPLPKELETDITAPLSTLANDYSRTWQIGNATVELKRTKTDSGFYLSFQF